MRSKKFSLYDFANDMTEQHVPFLDPGSIIGRNFDEEIAGIFHFSSMCAGKANCGYAIQSAAY